MDLSRCGCQIARLTFSEVYGSIINGRKAMGFELKTSYYKQAVKNCAAAKLAHEQQEVPLIATVNP